MKVVCQYKLDPDLAPTLSLPKSSEILKVGLLDGDVFLWVWVDTEEPLIERHFIVYGTGHSIDEDNLHYIDTVQMSNGLVLHVFEKV